MIILSGMLKRIELHNFMSHAHTVIELSPGLTVLTGPNNCGKSAFVSALQILAENTNGDYMVRHGAKECRVFVETADGHQIEWKRKKKTVSYTIDGQDYHRLRNSVPDVLPQILKLGKVKSGDSDEFDVHFGEQKSPIFLLNDRGSRAARFFASSSDASVLIEMQKLHRSKVQSAQQELKRQQAEEKQIAATMDLLAPVPDLESKLETLETTWQELSADEQQIQRLETLIQDLARSSESVKSLSRSADCLKGLPEKLEQENERPLESLVQRWQVIEQELRHSQVSTSALQNLHQPPALTDEQSLAHLISEIQHQGQGYQHAADTTQSLKYLPALPSLSDPVDLERLISQITSAEERNHRDREEVSVLARCESPPALDSGEMLEELCRQLNVMEAEVQQIQKSHREVEAEYEQVRIMLMQWVEENPTCPTCGAELEPDQFLQSAETGWRGHAHGK